MKRYRNSPIRDGKADGEERCLLGTYRLDVGEKTPLVLCKMFVMVATCFQVSMINGTVAGIGLYLAYMANGVLVAVKETVKIFYLERTDGITADQHQRKS